MPVELSSLDEVHDEVDAEVVLEDEVHAHDERVFNIVKDVLLEFEALKEVLVNDHIFADALHGIDFSCLTMHSQIDFSEGTFADQLHDLEVLETNTSLVFVLPCEDQGTSLAHGLSGRRLLSGLVLGGPALTLVVVIVIIVTKTRRVLGTALCVLLLTELNVKLQVH